MDFTHTWGRARNDISPLYVHPAKTNILNTVEYFKKIRLARISKETLMFAYNSETVKE